MKKQKLPKGWYMISDPCYVLSRETYLKDLLNTSEDVKEWENMKPIEGYVEIKGHKLFNNSTYIGDGEYYDNDGCSYEVDSGQLSCIPIELIEDERFGSQFKKMTNLGGRRLELFHKDFECSYDDGTFHFGEISIDTKGEMGGLFEEMKKQKTKTIKN